MRKYVPVLVSVHVMPEGSLSQVIGPAGSFVVRARCRQAPRGVASTGSGAVASRMPVRSSERRRSWS
jgi:hypothetical protein